VSDLQRYRQEVVYNRPPQQGPPGGGYPGYPGGNGQNSQDQFEQIIDLLYKGKWIILASLVLAVGVAAAYTYTQTPEYQTSALVMLNGQGNQQMSVQGMPGFGSSQWGRSPSTELMLLNNSQKLPVAVAERFLNDVRPTEGAQAFVRPWVISAQGDTLSKEQVARRIRSSIGFSTDGENGVIRFRSVSANPMRAYVLANMFASEYVELTKTTSRAGMTASKEFLENQLEEREAELRQVENRIETYLREKGTVSVEGDGAQLNSQVTALRTRRDQLEIEMERRKATIAALEQRLKELQPGLAEGLASTKQQDIELAQGRLGELKAQRQEFLTKNPNASEDDPRLRETNQQIEKLNQMIRQLSDEYLSEVMATGEVPGDSSGTSALSEAVSLRQQIAGENIAISGLEAEIEALQPYVEEYRAELKQAPGESLQMSRLRRDQQRASRMYEYVLQQLQEIRLQEQAELGYASIIANAEVPQSPFRPQSWRHLMMGAFFGLALGMGLALLRYQFDNRLYKPDELEALGYNTTIVPDMQKLIKSEYSGKALIERGSRKMNTGLMALHKPASSVAEAYRQLRTNLQLGLRSGGAKTIVVTSPGIGAGKTTTSANLAVAYARGGAKTLLIDADMRRPQIHNYLGLALQPGLYQSLKADEPVDAPQLETGIENLSALTAGAASGGDAAELLSSKRFDERLEDFKRQFDVIIIDTPPTLAVTEAKLLVARANATVVVTRAGETRDKELDRTIDELERAGANIMGLVLNGFNLAMAYNYRYRYRDYTTYGHYPDYARGEAA